MPGEFFSFLKLIISADNTQIIIIYNLIKKSLGDWFDYYKHFAQSKKIKKRKF